MANITEILGTDSVSSSRPTINSNFELLNDELASVTALLNPVTGVMTGLTSATAQQLSIVDGSTLFVVNTSGANVYTAATFSSSINLGGSIIKSGVVGTATSATSNLAPSSLDKGTYFIDGNFVVPIGVDGQEVTFISVASASVSLAANTGAALQAASVALDAVNSTVTLRCFNTKWYVVASHKATIL
jgi:hypothetical protein|tara:strand:+ start:5296 stop:5859 length:564 start_codon:yes stop_codon:yes gene_type:complete